MTDSDSATGLTPEISDTSATESEQRGVATISAAKIPMEVESINGFWLTPVDGDGDPDGPTTYHPTEIRP